MDGSKVDDAKGFKLMMAASHCHAPQELINVDSGEVLCNGTTHIGTSHLTYNEAGYLFTPPCLWGDDPDDNLMPPPVLMKNTTLQMVTVFNSTYWHLADGNLADEGCGRVVSVLIELDSFGGIAPNL